MDPGALDDLARRLGPGALVDAADRARYEVPARGAAGVAAAVVRPSSADEVRAVVAWARTTGTSLLAQGANTGLVGASTPDASGSSVVVSFERLAGPARVDPAERVALVDAGTRLSVLDAAAAAHGLHLPVDLAADPSIGGMVATNTGGTRVLRHGPLRHHLLGVEVVLADADVSVVTRLDALRKDSRGVELAQLVVGAGGALGLVTRAVLALTPRPEARVTWWLEPADEGPSVAGLLAALEADPVHGGALSALELVSAAALDAAIAHGNAANAPFGPRRPPVVLLAEWSGPAPALEGLDRAVAGLAAQGLVRDAVVVPEARSWAVRHAVSDGLRARGIVLGHDVATPRGALAAFRREAIDALRALVPRAYVADFGHAGDGGLHCNVVFAHEVDPPTADERAAVRALVDDLVAAHGGTYSAEHGLGPLNAERWLASTPPAEQAVVAALKHAVDPGRVLGHPGHPYNRLPRPRP